MALLNTRRLQLRTDSPKDNHCFFGTLLHFSLQGCPLEYLLLPPRSALKAVPRHLTVRAAQQPSRPSTPYNNVIWAEYRYYAKRHPFSGLIHSAGES